MKISRKTILLAGLGIVLVVGLLVSVPLFLKSYLNKNGKDLIGREISIEGLYHNALTGYTRISNFQMFEANDPSTFVSFDTLIVNLDLYKMFGNTLAISQLRIVSPVIQINHADTVFNFSDLIERFSSRSEAPTDSSNEQSLNMLLQNISLANGALNYRDVITDRQWNFDDINMAIPDLYFDNQNTDADLDLDLTDGSELQSSAQYNNQLKTYQVNLQLTDINLSGAKEYIQDYLDIADFGANMNADLQIQGKLGFPDQLKVQGNVDINDYYFDDNDELRFLSGEKVQVKIQEIIPMVQKVDIASITAVSPTIHYEFLKDSSDNIRPLIKTDTLADPDPAGTINTTETETTEQLDLLIRSASIENGKVDFKDHNPESPFEYQFFNILAEIKNISFDSVASLSMTADAPDNGELELKWEGNPFELDKMAFTLNTNIPGLPAFSPYTISFFDAPIEEGRFKYVSTNHVDNGNLEGLHTMMASGITLGKSTGIKSLYNVPLKVGLYLLEDKNGDIHLEVPVDGRVDDPNFRYSKVVVNAIVNGIVKLVSSPISLLGKLVGADDGLEKLEYNPVLVEITPEILAKLDYLGKAIEQKPDIKFMFTQEFDPIQASNDLALYLVKEDYYFETHDSDIKDYYLINSTDEKDPAFQEFVTSAAGEEVTNMESLIQACLQLKQNQVELAVDTIASSWNQMLAAELREKGVPMQNIQITPSTNDKGTFEYQLEAEMFDSLGVSK